MAQANEPREYFGGGQPLVTQGFPLYLEQKYNQTLRKLGWLTYDGLWRAAATGMGKGIFAVAALVMTASAAASSFVVGATMAEGAAAGLTYGLGVLTNPATALPLVVLGAIAGSTYDVANRQSQLQHDLADTRLQLRRTQEIIREEGLSAGQGRASGEGVGSPANYAAAAEKPEDYWQSHIKKHHGEAERGVP